MALNDLDIQTDWADGDTLDGDTMQRITRFLQNQFGLPLQIIGKGVWYNPDTSTLGFEVTDNGDGTVRVAAGVGIASHSSKGYFGFASFSPAAPSGSYTDNSANNWIHATIEISTNDTRETALPKFIVNGSSSHADGIALARVTLLAGEVDDIEDLRDQIVLGGAIAGPGSSVSGNIATFNGVGGDSIQDSGKALSTDATFAANSNSKVPTEAAIKTYIASTVAGLLDLKGSTDCSANPNYPSSSLKGDAYIVTVAGKIGGASGKVVNVGDVYIASADNAGGTEASVGTSWFVLEANAPYVPPTNLGTTATFTPALATNDYFYGVTNANATLANPTGTPQAGQSLIIEIKKGNTSHTLTLDSDYEDSRIDIADFDAALTNEIVTLFCTYSPLSSKFAIHALTVGV